MSDIKKSNKNQNEKILNNNDCSVSQEDVLKHLPEKIAYEHLQTQESKQFREEIKELIKERRKLLKEKSN